MPTLKESIAAAQVKRIAPRGFESGVVARVRPPTGDTGVAFTDLEEGKHTYTSSWGYFSASVSPKKLEATKSLFSKYFGAAFIDGPALRFYGGSLRSEGGLWIDTDHLGDGCARFQIPAEFLESIHGSQLRAFVGAMIELEPVVSRFDATLDHGGRGVTKPARIFDLLRTGKIYVQGFKHDNYRPEDSRHQGGGFTLYIGKRKDSQRFVRIYDKRGPTRYEVEFHDKSARQAWAVFSSQVMGTGMCTDVPTAIASLVLGAVRFKQKSGANTTRDSLAGFWSRFVASCDAEPIRLQPCKVRENSTITKLKNWISVQTKAALGKVQYAYRFVDPNLIKDLVEDAITKLTPEDKAFCRLATNGYIEGPDGAVLLDCST